MTFTHGRFKLDNHSFLVHYRQVLTHFHCYICFEGIWLNISSYKMHSHIHSFRSILSNDITVIVI